MVYAVIDTNVFVSAYMTHNLKSATSKVVQLLFKGEINILYNDEIIAEYVDVLSRPHLRINPVERIRYWLIFKRTEFILIGHHLVSC